jgi:hypothetical protein
MIFGYVFGMVAHTTNYLIEGWQAGKKWKLIVRYAIGSGVVACVYFWLTARRHGVEEAQEQLYRLMSANASVGFGVFTGWILGDLYEEYTE